MIKNIKLSKKEIGFGVLYALLFGVFSLYYGYFPGVTIADLGLNYCTMGSASSDIFCHMQTFYPYGGRTFEGYGVYFINNLFNIIVKDASISTSLMYLSLFFVSYVSFIYLAKKFIKNELLILGATIVFYLNPYFMSSIPQVGLGAMLISFSLFLDYKVYMLNKLERPTKKDYLCSFIIQFIGRLLVVSISWYIAVITAVFSCLWMLVYYVLKTIEERKFREILKFFNVVIPWFFAMLLILVITPSSTSSFSSGLDVLNGSSAPILSMLLPSDSLLISNVISTFASIVPEGYIIAGDGSMWGNYIGYSLLISFIIAIFLKTDNKKIKIAFVFTALVGLVLSIGPGLKFIGLIPDAGTGVNYHLDFSGTYMLPWANLYNVFPLTLMRAVYRWFLIFRVGVLVCAFCVWAKLWEKKNCKFLVLVLMSLAIVEYYPNDGVVNAIESKIANMEMLELYEEDVVNPLNELLDEDEVIAICSYGEDPNGYMVPYITELCDVKTYAGAGDKPKVISDPFIPNSIKQVQHTGDSEALVYYISLALEENQCDSVLLPYFNIRRESYYWRPSDAVLNQYRQIAAEIKGVLEERYEVYETPYFLLVKNTAEERYELINDESFIEIMVPDNEPIYQKKHIEIVENQIKEIPINLQNDDDIVYFATCYNGSAEERLCINIKELDDSGVCIKENVFECTGVEGYTFYENSLILQSETTSLITEISAVGTVDLKNFIAEGYNSNNLILSINNNAISNYLIEEEVSLVQESIVIEDNTKPYISEMTLGFDFYYENEIMDLSILSKQLGWTNEMSYAILLKGDYLTIALSNTGGACENFYIDKNVLLEGQWNTCKIQFDEGNLHVWINDQYFYKAYSFDSIYGSFHPISISAGDYRIRNLSLEYK